MGLRSNRFEELDTLDLQLATRVLNGLNSRADVIRVARRALRPVDT
jgi:hypothetical protein